MLLLLQLELLTRPSPTLRPNHPSHMPPLYDLFMNDLLSCLHSFLVFVHKWHG